MDRNSILCHHRRGRGRCKPQKLTGEDRSCLSTPASAAQEQQGQPVKDSRYMKPGRSTTPPSIDFGRTVKAGSEYDRDFRRAPGLPTFLQGFLENLTRAGRRVRIGCPRGRKTAYVLREFGRWSHRCAPEPGREPARALAPAGTASMAVRNFPAPLRRRPSGPAGRKLAPAARPGGASPRWGKPAGPSPRGSSRWKPAAARPHGDAAERRVPVKSQRNASLPATGEWHGQSPPRCKSK